MISNPSWLLFQLDIENAKMNLVLYFRFSEVLSCVFKLNVSTCMYEKDSNAWTKDMCFKQEIDIVG